LVEFLEAKKKVADLQALYKELMGAEQNFSALVMGIFGVGKTSFIASGRKPVLIDSFDPMGTVVLREEVEKGDVVIRPWWNEKSDNPLMFEAWYEQWEDDCRTGFLKNFGTYGIDSVTTLIQALANRTSKTKGRAAGILAQGDYNPMYATMRDIVKISSTQGCDFICTGHLVMMQNELTSEITAELAVYKGLKMQIPLLFTEKYVLRTGRSSSGAVYELLTRPDGVYHASTQLGCKDKFDAIEKPDMKHLLEKAGLPTTDKERLV